VGVSLSGVILLVVSGVASPGGRRPRRVRSEVHRDGCRRLAFDRFQRDAQVLHSVARLGRRIQTAGKWDHLPNKLASQVRGRGIAAASNGAVSGLREEGKSIPPCTLLMMDTNRQRGVEGSEAARLDEHPMNKTHDHLALESHSCALNRGGEEHLEDRPDPASFINPPRHRHRLCSCSWCA